MLLWPMCGVATKTQGQLERRSENTCIGLKSRWDPDLSLDTVFSFDSWYLGTRSCASYDEYLVPHKD